MMQQLMQAAVQRAMCEDTPVSRGEQRPSLPSGAMAWVTQLHLQQALRGIGVVNVIG